MDATSSSSSGAHVRSTSWSEDVHPLSRAIEDHLLILTQKPESSSCRKLGVLKNLYEVVEVFLNFQTTKTQEAFLEDGFLEVLDICSTIRDVLMQIKEQVRELESSLRRSTRTKRGGDHDQEAFLLYVFKRRTLSRTIAKQVKKTEDKMMEKKKRQRDCGDGVKVMKKVEETSFNVLVSLLIDVLTKNQSDYKQRYRSGRFLSRMFNKKNQDADVEELKKLRETEHQIEETEKDLDCVYKKLLKTRVSLLNMLTL